MEAAHDKDVKLLQKCSGCISGSPVRLLYRGEKYLLFSDADSIYIWSYSSKSIYFDDDSPNSEFGRKPEESKFVREDVHTSRAIPYISLGPEMYSRERSGKFHSVILSLNAPIHCSDVLRRGLRVSLAVMTGEGWLTVVTDSPDSEQCPYGVGVPIFHVDLFFRLHLLDRPGSVNFWAPTETSVFITDSSDRVCEVRFDHDLLSEPFSCPEVSVVYWTLESRMGISDNCRVTIVPGTSPDHPPRVQIIGQANNANSQGLVNLMNSRQGDDFFAATSSTVQVACFALGPLLILNSVPGGFRVLKIDNLDFPLFLRPAVAAVNLLAGQAELLCENGRAKRVLFDPLTQTSVLPGLSPSMKGSWSSEDWEASLEDSKLLVLVSLADPICRFEFPGDVAKNTPSFSRVFNHLVLCWGETVFVKQHLKHVGIVWRKISTRGKEVLTISEAGHCLFVLNSSTGQVCSKPIPPDLYDLLTCAEVVKLEDPFSCFHECVVYMYGKIPFQLGPYICDPKILALLHPSAELDRCCDFAGRRFLLAWRFGGPLTTQDIAWARLSQSRVFLMQEVVEGGANDWLTIQRSGMVFWAQEGEELSFLRTKVCEQIHKQAVMDYMQNRSVEILEKRVALWSAILGKQQMLATLYKSHGSNCASPTHTKVGFFLGSGFTKDLGIRNAFELVRQKRNELAISVFLFAGALQEAVDICARTDWQLAILILKIAQNGGPILEKLWTSRIAPDLRLAGDTWLCGNDHNESSDESVTALGPIAIETNRAVSLPGRSTMQSRDPTDTEWAWAFHQTGLSPLAMKLFPDSPLPPALKWAIKHEADQLG